MSNRSLQRTVSMHRLPRSFGADCAPDEIDVKANVVFAHLFVSGPATGARVYH